MVGRFLIRRFAGLIGVLVVMSLIIFVLQSIIPADPARSVAGPNAPAEVVERIRDQLGLNKPILVQYGDYVWRLLHGDLGTSVRTRQPVAADILDAAPASLELMLVALVLGAGMGAGVAAAQQLFRRAAFMRVLLLGLGSVPIFLAALLLVWIFWFQLDWFPGGGRIGIRRFAGPTSFMLLDGILLGRGDVVLSALHHMVLPALTLAIPIAVAIARSITSALETTMQQPFIRMARGKGLTEGRILLRHAARASAAAPLGSTNDTTGF